MKKNKFFIGETVYECVPTNRGFGRKVIKSVIKNIFDTEGGDKCSYECIYNNDNDEGLQERCIVYENFLFESESKARIHDQKNHPVLKSTKSDISDTFLDSKIY